MLQLLSVDRHQDKMATLKTLLLHHNENHIKLYIQGHPCLVDNLVLPFLYARVL